MSCRGHLRLRREIFISVYGLCFRSARISSEPRKVYGIFEYVVFWNRRLQVGMPGGHGGGAEGAAVNSAKSGTGGVSVDELYESLRGTLFARRRFEYSCMVLSDRKTRGHKRRSDASGRSGRLGISVWMSCRSYLGMTEYLSGGVCL